MRSVPPEHEIVGAQHLADAGGNGLLSSAKVCGTPNLVRFEQRHAAFFERTNTQHATEQRLKMLQWHALRRGRRELRKH